MRSLLLILALALAGCAVTPKAYDLSAAAPALSARGTLAHGALAHGALAVEASAEPPLDGDVIVIRTANGLERLGGAQWAETLPRLAQSRVTQSLENAGWRVEDSAAARLRVSIRRFEVDSVRREVLVELEAQLSGAARVFSAREPIGEISGAEPAQALDRAFSRVLADLARWTVASR
ncbi:cholesterol transport system auxiliary component [Rhodoblastus sphagnicola]|nr:ABC-type transport auxiliary lipoprotein family protein [Rhodoblastus sphagnicola]MBB4197981.1 cholesterol transport system auxiliary component [Rhodoblastus sphagnicola]